MSYYIEKIIDMVATGIKNDTPKKQLIDDIEKMLHDNWVAITGFGDD